MFDHLVIKSAASPVAQNMGGSYLTMFSKGGFIFGIINIIGGCPLGAKQAGWLAAAACFPWCLLGGWQPLLAACRSSSRYLLELARVPGP